MKKPRFLYIPWISFELRMVDIRRWFYVYVDGVKMDWWACEDEVCDVKCRYGSKVEIKPVPLVKTMLR